MKFRLQPTDKLNFLFRFDLKISWGCGGWGYIAERRSNIELFKVYIPNVDVQSVGDVPTTPTTTHNPTPNPTPNPNPTPTTPPPP